MLTLMTSTSCGLCKCHSPYLGVQFAAIPEFQAIGNTVGQELSAALAGNVTVERALEVSQQAAEREMRKGGYLK